MASEKSAKKSPKKSVKKLSVLLAADLHKRAKRSALQTDQSLTDLIITLLTQHLDVVDVAGDQPPSSN
jgi:predicted HicB family RNase H-like nuclease